MKLAIVGSRSRARERDKLFIFNIAFDYIQKFGQDNLILISGGCPIGADLFAEEAAKYFGVSITIHYPQQLPVAKTYSQTVERFYRRNRKIADECDVIYGLVSAQRRGGTEYTLNHAGLAGKECYLVNTIGENIRC